MQRQWVDGLNEGDSVADVYAISDCSTALVKGSGAPYLKVCLCDRTGQISAVRFDVTPAQITAARAMRYGRVRGHVQSYRSQLNVRLTGPLEDAGVPDDLSPFTLTSSLPLDSLRARLEAHIASVQEPHLAALLRAVFVEDTRLRARFETCPAAKSMHHAWKHGLIEHTLEVADAAAAIAGVQQHWGGACISRDLAVTGALLHDLGKLDEIEESDGTYDYSEMGNLLGHIPIGMMRLAVKIRDIPGFPKALRNVLLHMILAHHGKGEWGSPVSPMTGEALLLHMADQMSVNLYYMQEMRQKAGGAAFAEQSKLAGRPKYGGRPVFVGDYGLGTARPQEVPEHFVREESGQVRQRARLPILRLVTFEERTGDENIFATARLPLVGKIAAGQPVLAGENIEDYLDVEVGAFKMDDNHFLFRVQGDSMTGDGIEDGDIVVVRRQDQAEDGEIVVALLDDGLSAKRLSRQSDGDVLLLSSNDAHKPFPASAFGASRIKGKVVAIARHGGTTSAVHA